MAEAVMLVPSEIGDYTDFYASIFHATNVGTMLRPDNPLLPNYKYVPIGYHGRASSIVASGTPVRRPHGQAKPESAMEPIVGPSRRLDYELEVGLLRRPRQRARRPPFPIAEAESHLFGVCLVNDWSARDIQAWEYQPLGPFLAKSFATSVSPWVVTLEALEPFRVPALDPARRRSGAAAVSRRCASARSRRPRPAPRGEPVERAACGPRRSRRLSSRATACGTCTGRRGSC